MSSRVALRSATVLRPEPGGHRSEAGIVAAAVLRFDARRRVALLRRGAGAIEAALDPAVDAVVIETAARRRERVLAERDERGRWVVLGALRTAATPGVDAADEHVLRGKRITIAVDEEFAVAAGPASLVVRAIGYVETIAEDITMRARGVHKLVGRMLRLN